MDTISIHNLSFSFQSTEPHLFAFNGKENLEEITGWQDYGFRMYDDRIGRPPSIDPLIKNFPKLSPYQFFSNNPIWATDLDGLEANVVIYNNQDYRNQMQLLVTTKWSDVVPGQNNGHLGKTGTLTLIKNEDDVYNMKREGYNQKFDAIYSHLDKDNKLAIEKFKFTFEPPKPKEKSTYEKWKEYDKTLDGGEVPLLVKIIANINPLVSLGNLVKIISTGDEENMYGEKPSALEIITSSLDVITATAGSVFFKSIKLEKTEKYVMPTIMTGSTIVDEKMREHNKEKEKRNQTQKGENTKAQAED